jgi:hypothetical protein
MTPEQEAAFTEKLAKQFILIPKGRLYHVIGGALAVLVAAFGINIGSVVAYLRTQPAEKELKRIREISQEVERHYRDFGIGTFLKSEDAEKTFLKLNDSYHIRPKGTKNKFDLHVHHNEYKNGSLINLSSDLAQTWELVPE